MSEKDLKNEIISTGRLLWDKDLVTGLNGNISARVDRERILLTATKTCLGRLKESDVLLMTLDGEVLEGGQVSSERLIHTEIYKNFPDAAAVVHTHTTYTNAYFLENDTLTPRIFETKLTLGEVKAVPQATPAISDVGPVLKALEVNSIVVLKNHGVIAVGKTLFDCFLLIQCLEDAVKMETISRLYKRSTSGDQHPSAGTQSPATNDQQRKTDDGRRTTDDHRPATQYKLFSQGQIDEIVRLVNADAQMKDLGAKTKMTMDLAVKHNETGKVYSFHFEEGRIARVGHDENAEFLITAPDSIWRAVFNREIDPFVATTQKKMNLRGDYAKISKWYAPCSRIFEVWAGVPVE